MKVKVKKSAQQKPHAWLVNPKDKGRKSIKKGNNVYFKDGQNFEIELFNPLSDSVLTDIKVNGKSISKNGLVLRPGERFYLDCFLDDKKKFVFKTYNVENTNESINAIDMNGNVEILFYKEETLKINNWQQIFTPIVEKHYYPVYYPTYPTYPTIWYSNGITFGSSNTFTLNGSSTLTTSNSSNYFSNTIANTSNIGDVSIYNSSIETGRIEKGTSSNQVFEDVYMNFESHIISSIFYKILPDTKKPIETKEIKKSKKNENITEDGDKILYSGSVVDLIKKLADLHEMGILTDEEFNSKKKDLLSKI